MSDDAKFILFFIGALAVLSLLFTGFVVLIGGISDYRAPSDYTGQVVDLEVERGLVFQTTQAHLKTHRRSSEAETFCVHPSNHDEQLPQLREALQNGSRVTVTYSRPRYIPIWECESGTSIIREVEVHAD